MKNICGHMKRNPGRDAIKTFKKDRKTQYSYVFEIAMLVLGLSLNYLKIGMKGLFSFSTVGNYLIYIAFIGLFITTVRLVVGKRKLVDERMMAAAMQSNRITLVLLILVSFIVIVIDGIMPIRVPYSIFMSYLIMFVVLSNLVAYKALLYYKY